jgi:hypothetical protein
MIMLITTKSLMLMMINVGSPIRSMLKVVICMESQYSDKFIFHDFAHVCFVLFLNIVECQCFGVLQELKY